jgi:4-amino-4-deoxy-L-arabinose transferase-like glycosyltransferase
MTDAAELAPAEPAAAARRVPRALAWLAHRPRLVLVVLCLVLWTPGVFSLPPLDRDESRFAQASKQMLESGDLIDIRFGAVPRYKKPVGIYWMQAAATEIAGLGQRSHIWTYRLPSLLGALAAVLLAFWCARAFAAADVAFLASALLAGTLLLAAEATIATTDAVQLACVLGMQGMLFRAYLAAKASGPPLGRWLALAGWAAFGLGVLVKGPGVLVVAGATMAGLSLWDRNARWLLKTRPLEGVAIALVIVAPWFLAIALKSHGGFFQEALGHDFGGKLVGGQESHGALPGYFLALSSVILWPAILFLLPGLGAAIRARAEPAMRFLLVWAASWVLFELVPTKLPHYVLPVFPALLMLAAVWALKAREAEPVWQRVFFYVAPVQFALAAAALAAAAMILPGMYGEGTMWWVAVPVAVFALLSIWALVAYLHRKNLTAALSMLASAVILYPVLTAGVAPRLDQLWVSPRAAEAEKRLTRPGDPPPALAGYVEPSLVFLLGTETRQTDARGAAAAGAEQGGLALVEEREVPAFIARLAELEADATAVGAVDGFNYSRGRRVHIRIFRVTAVREMPVPPAE